MRKLFAILAALLSILLVGVPIYAQEATATPDKGWPVEKQCVGEPTKPPKGWSYDGTILMTGAHGIHAIRADWETTHVVASIRWLNVIPGGAGLSPDGKWYAILWGDIYAEAFRKPENYIHEIRVFSTESPNEFYRVNWDDGFNGLFLAWPEELPRMLWRDNEKIIYPDSKPPYDLKILDFKSGKNQNWNVSKQNDGIYAGYSFYPSLDWSRAVFNRGYGDTSKWAVYGSYEDQNKPIQELGLVFNSIITWSSDSQSFVAQTENNGTRQLTFFDYDGNADNTIFSLQNKQIMRSSISWSANGHYLAFAVFDVKAQYDYLRDYEEENQLYVVDFEQKQIINTCLSIGRGLAWSADNQSLAVLPTGDGKQPITVLDIADWQTYIAGYLNVRNFRENNHEINEGSIIGWRAD